MFQSVLIQSFLFVLARTARKKEYRPQLQQAGLVEQVEMVQQVVQVEG